MPTKKSENEIPKTYQPGDHEDAIRQRWDESDFAKPSAKATKKNSFAMVMPPPNVTGQLHLGHAITLTIEDILARYNRARGKETLWLPGTDHAGIATQNVVEKKLAETGKSRHDLGREKFIEEVWKWKDEYHDRIVNQTKKMGASCDWSREAFTLDDPRAEAVAEAFTKLYEKGLIYRDKKLVNWCPRCQTVLSDIEVDYADEEGHLYYIRYFVSATDRSICVATTRPETMLGDTAVAVHPDDHRYRDFVGKTLILPISNREIPIITDKRIDPEFGTGAVKITPAHDPLDAEIGRDHKLESIVVIGQHGKMTKHAGKRFKGMDLPSARRAVIKYLDDIGNLEKIVKHTHSVGHCSRCKTTVEPLESLQWFMKMKPLAEKAKKLVEQKKIEFVPARFEREFIRWMDEIRDWCLSRQLWWGHQLPVWYCKKVPDWGPKSRKKAKEGCQQIIVSKEVPKKCPHCGNHNLAREEDVLDTWFSSGLWPFSTLGWPKRTKDYSTFYPNSTLETGYDILFFWVARMVMLGAELTGKEPFKTVYLHGIVRDAEGRKMSKSLGNGIDPLEMSEQFGTDALRLSLTVGMTPGNDLRFSEDKISGQRNFVNKLWNASRYILGVVGKPEIVASPTPRGLPDRWILSRLNRLIEEVTTANEKHAFGEAAVKIQEFVRDEFCDWYLELTKEKPNKKLLAHVLTTVLKLAHPFIPFVTEKIWEYLHPIKKGSRAKPKLLASEKWPRPAKVKINDKTEEEMNVVIAVISTIRSVRNEMGVEAAKKIGVIINAGNRENFLKKQAAEIKKLARLSSLQIKKSGREIDNAVAKFTNDLELFFPLDKLLDPEQEKKRLRSDLAEAEKYLALVEKKLANKSFIDRAPKNVVAAEKAKKKEVEDRLKKIEARLKVLK